MTRLIIFSWKHNMTRSSVITGVEWLDNSYESWVSKCCLHSKRHACLHISISPHPQSLPLDISTTPYLHISASSHFYISISPHPYVPASPHLYVSISLYFYIPTLYLNVSMPIQTTSLSVYKSSNSGKRGNSSVARSLFFLFFILTWASKGIRQDYFTLTLFSLSVILIDYLENIFIELSLMHGILDNENLIIILLFSKSSGLRELYDTIMKILVHAFCIRHGLT